MFQTPMGGISIMTNIAIVIIGKVVDTLRNRSKFVHKRSSSVERLFISQEFDHLTRRMFAYLIPIFVFLTVLGVTMHSLYLIVKDSNRVSLVQFSESVYHKAKPYVLNGISIFETHNEEVKNLAAVSPTLRTTVNEVIEVTPPTFHEVIGGSIGASITDSVGKSEQLSVLADILNVFTVGTDVYVVKEINLDELLTQTNTSINDYVLSKGRELPLRAFMKANGLDDSFESRMKFIEYFGLRPYRETEIEDQRLKNALLSIKFSDLKEEIQTISE